MAVIKCKMCGGDLNIVEGESVCECEYCGTRQTIPSTDNEKKLTLFARANRLRLASEFDKAFGIYENIVAEFPEEAEAYWGLVLCKYGIEYVDDPATGKKIPTCHRSSFESVMEDEDFEQVMENSDPVSRKVYREEAKQIEEIRKGVLEVSGKEEPYDIFICYKENDENGDRTLDSVLAQDLYDALIDKGYRVFFSRITLEDKLGQEYEPYIFAALNSAKVMLAVGTDYEYYNAVWVKNEWSRYLKLMEKDKERHLIPCYKNLDAYDIPKEFARLQAQDLGKVGGTQDLLRGVEKLLGGCTAAEEAKPEKQILPANEAPGPESLLKRANLFLEYEEWDNAKEYYNRVLDFDPECAEAYLGLSLAEVQYISIEQAAEAAVKVCFSSKNMKKAERFAEEELRKKISDARILLEKRISEKEEATRIAEEEHKRQSMEKAKALAVIREKIGYISDYFLSTGDEFAVGLRSNGTVAVLGENRFELRDLDQWTDIVAISADRYHTVGLRSDGTVVAVKSGYSNRYDVSDWTDIVAISAGGKHVVGLRCDGTVVADGENRYGQCNVAHWTDIVAISTGEEHTVGLRSDGTVLAVGNNREGRCNVDHWTDIVAICTGDDHTVGLRSDGTVVAVGKNQLDQCEVSQWRDIVEIRTERRSTVGLQSDGTVVTTSYQKVSDWTDIVAVSKSFYDTVGLRSDGTVVAAEHQAVSDWTDIVAICAGDNYILGIHSDGTAVLKGDNNSDCYDVSSWKLFDSLETAEKRKNEVLEWRRAKELQAQERIRMFPAMCQKVKPVTNRFISAGYNNSMCLRSDGTVVAVGNDDDGQCKASDWRNIAAISVGMYHMVGLRSDGAVVAVGNNDDGQCRVSNWRDIVAVSAGYDHTVGLRSDGTVVATEYTGDRECYCGQCEVSDWSDIVAISAGYNHTVGLRNDGTVVAVGSNIYDMCDVSNWRDIVAVSAGDCQTVGLCSDGRVVAAGSTIHGLCKVSGWRSIVAVSAGSRHTVGLCSDATVVAVGDNNEGQCEVSGWRNIVAISAGFNHTVGLRSDGTVVTTDKTEEVSDWKLFGSLETIEQEQKAAHKQYLADKERCKEEECLAEERRREEERVAQEKRRLEEERQSQGLCPYCGGTFKGLLKKVCTQCGKPKDY